MHNKALLEVEKQDRPLRVAMIVADDREALCRYELHEPFFGPAPSALLSGLSEITGAEIHIISCVRQSVRAPSKLAGNIYYHALQVPKWGFLRSGYLPCLLKIRKKLRELQPDVVHGQGTERYYALAATCSRFPNVITIHGNMVALAKVLNARVGSFYWWTARLENYALARTGGVICNSAYTENLVRPRTKRTWRVPNALLPRYFSRLPAVLEPHPPILVNVGNVAPFKRQVELLDLAAHLYTEGYQFELRFLGRCSETSSYNQKFLNKIRAAEKAGYAKYLGEKTTDEVIQCLDAASGMIHFPSEEAFGLAVAEGLSRNLKLFGSAVGGVMDIVEGVEQAEIFREEDWNGLREAIARWLKAGCPRPTSAAALMRQRYSSADIARRHMEIYSSIQAQSKI